MSKAYIEQLFHECDPTYEDHANLAPQARMELGLTKEKMQVRLFFYNVMDKLDRDILLLREILIIYWNESQKGRSLPRYFWYIDKIKQNTVWKASLSSPFPYLLECRKSWTDKRAIIRDWKWKFFLVFKQII